MELSERPTPETDAQSPFHYYIKTPDGVTTHYVPADFARKLERERDEARELARNLYWAGHELRRFARAYANDYDEVDGKQGADEADDAFYEASINLAKVLGDQEAAK